MTLEELLTDLRAAGANENTLRLAMNCYELGRVNERDACKSALATLRIHISELPTITSAIAAIEARSIA